MGRYKKFIKKVFDDESSSRFVNWRKRIEEAFPGEFHTHKIGDWIWVESDEFLGRGKILIYFNGYYKETYGFGENGEWDDTFNGDYGHRYGSYTIAKGKATKATDESVMLALTEEATKRGFIKGAVVIPVGCKEPQTIDCVFHEISSNAITANATKNSPSILAIYYFGKWATLVDGEISPSRDFKDKDMVEIIANRTFHKIPIGTVCELETNHTDGSWLIWYDGSRHGVVDSDIKHVN